MENASHKAHNSKIIYTVGDANEQNITLPVFNYWEQL